MSLSRLKFDKAGYVRKIVEDLITYGWTIESIPSDGKLPRNRAFVALKTGDKELRFRISAYKVTGSSRQKAHERRVEITTTYRSGLRRQSGLSDVVLGVRIRILGSMSVLITVGYSWGAVRTMLPASSIWRDVSSARQIAY